MDRSRGHAYGTTLRFGSLVWQEVRAAVIVRTTRRCRSGGGIRKGTGEFTSVDTETLIVTSLYRDGSDQDTVASWPVDGSRDLPSLLGGRRLE